MMNELQQAARVWAKERAYCDAGLNTTDIAITTCDRALLTAIAKSRAAEDRSDQPTLSLRDEILALYRTYLNEAVGTRCKDLGTQLGLLQTRPGTIEEEQSRCIQFDTVFAATMRYIRRMHSLLDPTQNHYFFSLFQHGQNVGTELRILAEENAIALHKVLGGVIRFRPLSRLVARPGRCEMILEHLQDGSMHLVQEAYLARYHTPLEMALRKSFRGLRLQILLSLASGNRVDACAYQFLAMLNKKFPSRISLFRCERLIRSLDREQRKSLILRFQELSGGRPLVEMLQSCSPLRQHARIAEIVEGSFALLDARELHGLLHGHNRKRMETIFRLMKQSTPKERIAIQGAYLDYFGMALDRDVALLLPKGPERDLVLGWILNDPQLIEAATLRCGICKVPGEWLGRAFLGKALDQRTSMIRSYETVYKPRTFLVDVERSFKGRERELLLDLISHGFLSWGKLFFLCMSGFGTDEAGLRSLLEDASFEQLKRAKQEFRTVWEQRRPWYEKFFPSLLGDLEKRVWLETGGDSWFDFREYLLGTAVLQHENQERLERLYLHERSAYLLKKLDFFSHEGTVMNADVALTRSFHEKFIKNTQPSEGYRKRFDVLVRYAELDCATFRELKHFIGNLMTNMVAAAAAFSAAVALTLLDVRIGRVMLLVAMVSISTRFTLKRALKGRGYHRDECLADICFGAVDGMTLFTSQFLRQALIRTGTNIATKTGLKTGVSRLSRLVNDIRTGGIGLSVRQLAEEPGEEKVMQVGSDQISPEYLNPNSLSDLLQSYPNDYISGLDFLSNLEEKELEITR